MCLANQTLNIGIQYIFSYLIHNPPKCFCQSIDSTDSQPNLVTKTTEWWLGLITFKVCNFMQEYFCKWLYLWYLEQIFERVWNILNHLFI